MQHIYLSPHFDDAVYSCGGMIQRQARAGEPVRVVTVFAGQPEPGALSPLAGRLHREWHHGADALLQRAREDTAALRVLGATGERWALRDAIYRQAMSGAFLYPTFEALFQPRHADDQGLIGVITGRLLRLAAEQSGEAVFYAPLGIGGHVDHGLVYEAGRHLLAVGCTVLFYEDLPYVANSPVLLGRVLSADPAVWWQPQGGAIDLQRKVQAMACYPSQSRSRLVHQITDYARRVGGAADPAERVWRAERRPPVSVEDWARLLTCPRCRGAFRPAALRWTCEQCGHTYPVQQGILDLHGGARASRAAPGPSRQRRPATVAPAIGAVHLLGRLLRDPLRPRTDSPATAGLALGCRSADGLLALASVSARVVGVDNSMRALQRTHRLLDAMGRGAGCLLIAATPQTLPCRDHVFGHVIVDPRATTDAADPAFRLEVRRVLQPGGIILFHAANPFRALAQAGLTAGLKILPGRLRARVARNLRNQGSIR